MNVVRVTGHPLFDELLNVAGGRQRVRLATFDSTYHSDYWLAVWSASVDVDQRCTSVQRLARRIWTGQVNQEVGGVPLLQYYDTGK